MEELQEFSEAEESNFDLKAEIYKYLAHWKWLVFGSLLGLLLAFLYNRYTIPEYRTEASMMILQDEQKRISGALPGGGILTTDDSGIQNHIENLRSKRLVENVVNELDLNVSYFNEGNVIAVEAYKSSSVVIQFLSSDSIVHAASGNLLVTPESETTFRLKEESFEYDEVHKFGEIVKLGKLEFFIEPRGGSLSNNNTVNIQISPLRKIANDYISKMEISSRGKAEDILALSVTGEVKQKSQDFLNTLMKHFNFDGMADKRQVSESTAAFIQDRLQRITGELDSVESDIAEFKQENQFLSVDAGASQYITQSTSAEQEVFTLETQLMIIRSIRETLTSSDPYRLLPSGVGVQEAGIAGGINNYNTLVLERNEYLRTSTQRNPVVQTLTDQIDALRSNILDNIESTINSLQIRIRELDQRSQRAEGEFSAFPGLEQGMRNIVRQQQIKEQLYLFLLQRREESAISSAATSPVAKVIDPAFSENTPVDPKPWFILLGGFLIGFIIPLLVVFVKNFLDTKVHHKGDLQKLNKHIPFLGEIPKVSPEGDDIIQVNDRSPLAESFRILRTNLAYLVQSRNKEKAEVIFITSTIKGEGKTFVSYNLSRTLASTGKSVLLIGADIRNPKLHKFTGATVGAKGLSDYLYNYDLNSNDVITPTNQGDIPVDLILSGAIPPNPAELLMNNRMEKLIESEKNNYDYIIVDTAPTMIVTDTLLISPLADTTLYITRAGYTEKKLLDFPKDLREQGKLKGVAIVLNDVDYSKFSYGAKYGYSYGYGYGYGADDEKKSLIDRLFNRKKA
ncbi:tyrosine protein kinase [Salinimicrobium marinum]|uniref:non-specific protein-tyrosine kinase n=1 Tax=Salinimicrobium marinum TaxID=680283 RepID=A0A918VUL4_9FLAO|nr:tyrosine-protein kinase [Salinimicrobium marinum]GHA30415.1 tyrosine protein kinase [Salinimicrobium marinum]